MQVLLYPIIVLILLEGTKFNYIDFSKLTYLDETYILVCLLIAIKNILKEKKINKSSFKLLIGIMTFLFIGIISCILNSNYTFKSLIMSSFLAIKFWILVFSIQNIKINGKTKKTIIKAILFVEKIAIVLAILNIFFPNIYYSLFTFEEKYIRFGMQSITSCFNHPATYGWFMLVCAFIHLSKYQEENTKKEKKYVVLLVVLSVLSLRTKILITIILSILFYVIFINKNNIKKLLKNITIALAFSIIIFFSFKEIILNTYNIYFKSEQGISAREALSIGSKKIIKDYFPLGVGFGKYGTWYASQQYSEYYYKYEMNKIYGLSPEESKYSTDTFWPAIMGETGIIGTTIYIVMIIYCLKNIIQNYKENRTKTNEYAQFNFVAIFIFLQTIIESSGEASFNTSPKYVITALFVGIALSGKENNIVSSDKKRNTTSTKLN